jgi:soluble lytic murein transglycosylase
MLNKSFVAVMLLAAPAWSQPLATIARNYHDHPNAVTRAAVLNYASAHSKDTTGALALLVLGSGEMDGKEWNAALTHLNVAEKRLPMLSDYAASLKAAAEFELHDPGKIEKDLKPVWDNTPSSPLIAKAVILEANAYIQTGDPKKAIHLLEQRGDEVATEKTALLLAKSYEAAGDTAAAGAQYQRLYTEYPMTKEADDAEPALQRYPLTPQARLSRCAKLLDGRDFTRAKKELEALLLPHLNGADNDAARVLLGAAYYLEADYQKAFTYFKSLEVSAAQRLFYLAQSARRLDRISDMDSAVAQLTSSYPTSKWRLQALVAAGNYYAGKNEPTQYEPLFRACYDGFPNDSMASYCHWRTAWAEYMKDRSKGVLFLAHLKQYPSSDLASAARDYLGRIAEMKGDASSAHAWYEKASRDFPNEYYGVLSRDRLKETTIAAASASPQVTALLATIHFTPSVNPDLKPSAVTQARLDRAHLLASAGLDDLADSELRYGARHDGQPQIAAVELARLATGRNAPDQGIRLIKHYAPGYLTLPLDATTEALWRFAFPLPFWKSLTDYAAKRGLDPYLIAGLIRQESEFNPKVVSYANAYGLTQVMPATGREISRKLKIRPFRPSMLFTPDVNLDIGTFYLRNVLDSLEGKYEAALASYNAGRSRVVKWMSWTDFREPAEFVESIPILQTHDYVQSVLRNADVYRRLYGSNPVALASTEDGDSKNTRSAGTANKSTAPVSQRPHRKLHRVGNS